MLYAEFKHEGSTKASWLFLNSPVTPYNYKGNNMNTDLDKLIELVLTHLKEAIESQNVEQMGILSQVYQRLCSVR